MSRDVLSRTAPPPDRTVRYGPHPEQVVDLRLAKGGAPTGTLVVLVHGGFWRSAYDRAHIGPLADALARAGHAVAVPEYRRVDPEDGAGPGAVTPPSGGGWPATFDDVAMVLDGLDAVVAAHGIRAERTVLVGHSAGGHLALWAAARHRLPEGSPWHTRWRPDAVVPLAGCSSLALTDSWGLGAGAVSALLGGGADDVPERYAVADSAALLPLGVPVTLLHGTEDASVPVAMSREYAELARGAGDPVRLVELPGMEHFLLIDPLSEAFPVLLDAIGSA